MKKQCLQNLGHLSGARTIISIQDFPKTTLLFPWERGWLSFWKHFVVHYYHQSIWYFFPHCFSCSKLFRHNYRYKSLGTMAQGSCVSINTFEASVVSSLVSSIPTLSVSSSQWSLKCADGELDCWRLHQPTHQKEGDSGEHLGRAERYSSPFFKSLYWQWESGKDKR